MSDLTERVAQAMVDAMLRQEREDPANAAHIQDTALDLVGITGNVDMLKVAQDVIQAIETYEAERRLRNIPQRSDIAERLLDASQYIDMEDLPDEHAAVVEAAGIFARLWRERGKAKMPWRPIDSAPKDGEPILCLRGTGEDAMRFIARWWTLSEDGGWSLDLGGNDECLVLRKANAPTHWMPLPAPPQE